MGERGGTEVVNLRLEQIPTHSHSATPDLEVSQNVSDTTATDVKPTNGSLLAEGNYPSGKSKADVKMYTSDSSSTVHLKPNDITGTVGIGNTGGGQPHENRQPYQAVNFMICIEGIFPSPN